MKVKNLEGNSGRAIPNQKGHDYIVIGRFIIRYYEGMR